jgi:pSer/pThr/pTyr-binding forkhead associated (FHA) protein
MSGIVFLAIRIIASVVLFIFLGWAFWQLWKDLKQQAEALEYRQLPAVTLQIQNSSAAAQQQFHQAVIIIGRDPGCDFPIDDELISAHHARIHYHLAQWWAEDMGSKNGTHLNQDPVTIPTVVISGDILQCGKTDIIVKIG